MRLVSRNGIRVSRRRGDVKHKKARLNQRRRTRAALVDAATQAVQRGETPPTIEDAAEAAGVSRATAHLYFTSQQSLLLKALLDVMGTIPDPSLVDEGPVESRVDARYPFPCADGVRPRTRPAHLSNAFLGAVAAHPPEEQRELPLRKGRRIAWLDRALAPLKSLSPRQRCRLGTALTMLCGVEAMIVAKDVCRCSAREAEDASRWAAQAILRAALTDSPA